MYHYLYVKIKPGISCRNSNPLRKQEVNGRPRKFTHLLLAVLLIISLALPVLPLQAQEVRQGRQRKEAVDTKANIYPTRLKVNGRSRANETVGRHPEFSWQVDFIAKQQGVIGGISDPDDKNIITGYQVRLLNVNSYNSSAENQKRHPKEAAASKEVLWNSGKINTIDAGIAATRSTQLRYTGNALQPDRTYGWQVRIWDQRGRVSPWTEVDIFRTGLFKRSDWWGARWIGASQMSPSSRILPGDTATAGRQFGTANDTLPLMRKSFVTNINRRKKIIRATLYISGLGQFEASLNGRKIGDHFLDPGWTDYQKEALYLSFDVTGQIKPGSNTLGVELGNGFYYIPNVKHRYKKLLVQYGYPKMICRLSIAYSDGSHQNVVSDGSWKTAPSAITFSSIYGGETMDGRLQPDNWNQPDFPDKNWSAAILVTDTPRTLRPSDIDPIKVMASFSPVAVFQGGIKSLSGKGDKPSKTGRSSWVYDMGQNCSAIAAITVRGKKGDTIRLIPAELLTEDGLANQKATGSPYILQYILPSDGVHKWQPKFTYYGFRYVEVEGAVPVGVTTATSEKRPRIEQIKALHIRNSAPEAGHFACSNELFNKTYELIRWGIKSNMMSVFTDCPHREKLGWLEQVHLMGNSVRYNWQIDHLLKKTIQDMRDAQTSIGLIPEIAPEFTVFTWGGDMFRDSPEWGSSSIIVPWYLYQWYGDSSELRKSYSMMTRYIDYLGTKAKAGILYQGLGDWYDLGPNGPGVSQLTPAGLTGTAIYYYDLCLLDKIAGLLNHPRDQQQYQALLIATKKAFNDKFLHQEKDSTGQHVVYYGSGSQTADAMAVYMNLVPAGLKDKVVKHLIEGIKANKYGLTAGDIGYRYVLRVLEQEGYSEVIYRMNSRSDVPGYGYQLAKGATALTESWQALSTVSNNHFMLGHLMEWFYSGVLGIRQAPGVPGCSQMIIQPEMVGDLTWAKGDYQTPYGSMKVDWQKQKTGLILKVRVPIGVKAKIRLPYYPGMKIRQVKMQKRRRVGRESIVNYSISDGGADLNGTLKDKALASFEVGAGEFAWEVK
ncbi:MAG TPA: family 78 glycoside hydrolase catalytic domain [Arachidicoccus sp.]|nr:family 78 glycoside hydrolase catalytic domain [Arachidicoccus sp.]